ncbi:MAG: SRPBCC domain-containing protein [Paenibacillaceae bacterium]
MQRIAQRLLTRHPGSATWPLEVLNTMTFVEQDGKTTLTLRGAPLNATEEEYNTFKAAHDGVKQGFAGTFAQLEEYLAKI